MPVRSGPFSFEVPGNTTDSPKQVIFGGAGAVYRFFNSTDRSNPQDKKFELSMGWNGAEVKVAQDLHATMSLDLAVGSSSDPAGHPLGIRVIATNSSANPEEIRGSFDLIRASTGVLSRMPSRSGRFNFPKRVPNAFLPVQIVNLTNSAPNAIYRIHNTGEKPFKVFVAVAKNTAKVFDQELGPSQAMDLEISDAQKRNVFVARINNDEHIKGVFDLIG